MLAIASLRSLGCRLYEEVEGQYTSPHLVAVEARELKVAPLQVIELPPHSDTQYHTVSHRWTCEREERCVQGEAYAYIDATLSHRKVQRHDESKGERVGRLPAG